MARIAGSGPSLPRGTLAYQPIGFGWILGEVVRRVSGKPIERFIQEELLAPCGLDRDGGLRLGVPASELGSLAKSYWLEDEPPVLGGERIEDFELAQNSAEWLGSVVPGGGTIGSARALARVYDWLLRGAPRQDGTPLVGETTLRRYTTAQTRGLDRTLKIPLILGRGFQLGWFWPHPFGWWRTSTCFGHGGNFSTLAWADPESECAIAYVTNGNRSPSKLVSRCAPLGSALEPPNKSRNALN